MEDNTELSLKEEIEKEANRIEERIASSPELDNIETSLEMDKSLYTQIEKYNANHFNIEYNKQLNSENKS